MMSIGGVDEKETTKLRRRMARKGNQLVCNDMKALPTRQDTRFETFDDTSDDDYLPHTKRSRSEPDRNTPMKQMSVP